MQTYQGNRLWAFFSAARFFFILFILTKWINSKIQEKLQPLPTHMKCPFGISLPFFIGPTPLSLPKHLKTQTHFQNIFEIESMLQISVNFFFLAPAAKSHAGKLEVCNVLIESV